MRIVFHKLLSNTFVLHEMNGAWLCQLAGLFEIGLQKNCIHVHATPLIQFLQTTSSRTGQAMNLMKKHILLMWSKQFSAAHAPHGRVWTAVATQSSPKPVLKPSQNRFEIAGPPLDIPETI